MFRQSVVVLAGMAILAGAAAGDTSQCACDVKKPETLKARECSLCAEAEKQPPGTEYFVLKDVNPRKPNRWLVLPRAHAAGAHPLHELPAAARGRLWRKAMEVGAEKFGTEFGVAYNGAKVRTQCHTHVHVGRWIPAAETSKFRLVRRIEDIPAPADSGVLVRPVKGGYLVLMGEHIVETALVR
ncbi:MAG: hypothetical protein HY858_04875 [Candidatus Solibacter usitatus]|nr:hypothetical protein [Candidatus Solibacter usitatus]